MKKLLIDKILYNNILSYCKINGIKDINIFVENLIKKQFYIECYGELVINNDTEHSIIRDKEMLNIAEDNIKEESVKEESIKEESKEELVIKSNVIKTILK